MFKGYPEIIRTKLKKWERGDLVRYYFNDWPRYLSYSQTEEYREKYSIDPEDREVGIKVYFDDEGYLHIDNCHDPDLKVYLEEKMKQWYRSAEDRFAFNHSGDLKIMDLIGPYITKIGPGSYQVKHGGSVFSFDESYMDYLKHSGYLPVDHQSGNYSVHTGKPELDKILADIIEEDECMMFTGLFQ